MSCGSGDETQFYALFRAQTQLTFAFFFVDVTPSHVAHSIRDQETLIRYSGSILRYGTRSARLRDGVAALTRRLTNNLFY